jgi:hypothetical protein
MKNPFASAASALAAVTLVTACLGASAVPGADHLCNAGGWCTYYTYQVVA